MFRNRPTAQRYGQFVLAVALAATVGVGVFLIVGAGRSAEPPDPNRDPPDEKVARGQSLWALSARYQIDPAALAQDNQLRLDSQGRLLESTRVHLPADGEVGRSRRIDASRRELGLNEVGIAGQLYRAQPDPRWVHAAGPAQAWHGELRWPVDGGHWVRGFGSGDGDYHLAVDVAAEWGSDVLAAAPGLVAFTGDAIEGYGNVVFLVHPGGPVTMYAHNDAIVVQAGQRVDAGEVIAKLGSTGKSRGPHVHFELLYAGKNCNPRALFRPGIRETPDAGIELPEPAATWPKDGPPRHPDIPCHERRHRD